MNATLPAEWVTTRRAAEIVGCSAATIARYARQGRIERRETDANLPSLHAGSVDDFALWWWTDAGRRHRPGIVRHARRQPVRPAAPHEWIPLVDLAALMGVRPLVLSQLVGRGRLAARLTRSRTLLVRTADVAGIHALIRTARTG